MIDKITDKINNCYYQQLEEKVAIQNDIARKSVVTTFEKIINDSLRGRKVEEKPFILNVSGIPGSGKTTYCLDLTEGRASFNDVDFSNILYLSFDRIMTDPRLPYETDARINQEYAFKRWELPSRIAGYELLKRAVDRRINILFEHSSSVEEHIELFNLLMDEYGYDVHFLHLDVDKQLAKERVMKRAEEANRTFSPGRIDERHESLIQLLPKYKEVCTTFTQVEQ